MTSFSRGDVRFRSVLGVLTLLLLAPACRAVPPRTPAPVSPEIAALRHRMEAIGAALGSQGFREADEFIAGLSSDRTALFKTRFPSKTRVVAVAIGPLERPDLNLSVTCPSGGVIAKDNDPSVRGVVEWVALPAVTYEITVSAAGTATGMVKTFASERLEVSARLAGLFDADPIPRRRWVEIKEHLRGLGFTPSGETLRWEIESGERHPHFLDVEKGRCIVVAARGSRGLDRLSLRLYGAAGLLSADLRERPFGAAAYCAETSERIRAVIEATAGSGSVTGGVFGASHEAVRSVMGPPLEVRETPRSLESSIARQIRALETRGYHSIRILADTSLSPDLRISLPINGLAGECFAIRHVAASTLQDVDLELFRDGKRVASNRDNGASPSLGACARADSEFQLEVIALKGTGRGVVVAGTSTALADLALPPSLDFRLQEIYAAFGGVGLHPTAPVALTRAKDGLRAEVPLSRDRCHGIAVVSHAPIYGVVVRDDEGISVASWTGDDDAARLSLCPGRGGMYSVEVTSPSQGDEAYVIRFD